MAIQNNPTSFTASHHFLFRNNEILLQLQSDSDRDIYVADKIGFLPSEKLLQRCLILQAASDWFTENDTDMSVMELESDCPNPSGCISVSIRTFFASANAELVNKAARAKSLLSWRKTTRFCSQCGTPLIDETHCTAKKCPHCNMQFFPRIEPAVIVVVHKDNQILLARHKQRIQNIWACLSGFVEVGETLEQCVYREIKEESGISVKNIIYRGSQGWPFPDQLMAGFTAEYDSGSLHEQADEILELKWFDQDNLPQEIPPAGSIAHTLITTSYKEYKR
ncbi:MAG: NAD(+) diphosphatase [Treponema sp.]|nr:NAD(+) diphosphatase [Treponema sp.]